MSNPDNNTVNIEIDGIATTAEKGSMIIEAADRIGVDIPRFCYHPKLSIAANCRMCLVDVEKAPKPVPACATPVMEGMKIYTESRRAVDAQRGVMEFLLINHPLDCPICDQGGECELQDQAMGYGRSVSRFSESKRVVADKDIGPLIQTEMTRCIHCTRCIRFLDEVAGTTEMGGIGRGDRTEIGTMVARSIDSELSGNIIDICPVGALTNKPFRFSARAWEMLARPSVSSHDGVNANLYYHTRRDDIMRCVPRDNEALNECWLADRDRYAHFGLRSENRVTEAMVKGSDGKWQIVGWEEAIERAAELLRDAGDDIGALMSPSAFNEEYLLARRLLEARGSRNIDHRLRESACSDDSSRLPQFECAIADMDRADAVLLIGSNIHQDAPLLGQRLRRAWRENNARVFTLLPRDWEYRFDTTNCLRDPHGMLDTLLSMARELGDRLDREALPVVIADAVEQAEVSDFARDAVSALKAADNALIVVGKMAMAHPLADWYRHLSSAISKAVAGRCNQLGEGGNSTGARRYGGQPGEQGQDCGQMLARPPAAVLLWDADPQLDFNDPQQTRQALADTRVVAVSSYSSPALLDVADVILPLAATPESTGSLTSFDGQIQFVQPATRAPGMSRPGWKILRRLGAAMAADGFDFIDLNEVSLPAEPFAVREDGSPGERLEDTGLQRLGEVGIYAVNAQCRESEPLQQTAAAQYAPLQMHPLDIEAAGLDAGAVVRVRQGENAIELELSASDTLARGCVLLPAAQPASGDLGAAWGRLTVEAK